MISRIPCSGTLQQKSSHADNVMVSGYHSNSTSGNHQLQSSQRDQLSMSLISCSCNVALAAPPFLRWLWLVQNFVWNFKVNLGHLTQSFEPTHRKICICWILFLSGMYDIFNCDVISLSEMVPCASGSHLWQLQALTGGRRNWREGEFFGNGNFFWNTQLGVENQWNTPHVWVSNCFAWCKFGLD